MTLLKSAKNEIHIALSFAAYGEFSSPDFFAEYKATLQDRARHGVKVEILVPDIDYRKQRLEVELHDRWLSYVAWRERKNKFRRCTPEAARNTQAVPGKTHPLSWSGKSIAEYLRRSVDAAPNA
jgi:hypothetical protein